MNRLKTTILSAFAVAAMAGTALADDVTLTIATVNNGDMIRMQKLTDDFSSLNPGIKLNWVTLEENDLRQKVTKDITTNTQEPRRAVVEGCHGEVATKSTILHAPRRLDRPKRRSSLFTTS